MTAATNTTTNTAAAKNTTIKSWADIGHADREQLAEDMGEAGLLVTVERFGTGNGLHSGVIPGCGVSYLTARPNPYANDDGDTWEQEDHDGGNSWEDGEGVTSL
jgi:hypothetical protein